MYLTSAVTTYILALHRAMASLTLAWLVCEETLSTRQGWSDIMTAVAADPWASAYTIFDILNEPDSHGLTWQASNGHPGVGDLYHEVMTTGYSINPSARCKAYPCGVLPQSRAAASVARCRQHHDSKRRRWRRVMARQDTA